jgi:hypothetical protein
MPVDDLIAGRTAMPADPDGHLPLMALKWGNGRQLRDATDVDRGLGESAFARIRCPVCAWQPSASSLWCCASVNTPEPPFDACGTFWNTFDTEGLCPGCAHQWVWTTCLRCGVASRHAEWYDVSDDAR